MNQPRTVYLTWYGPLSPARQRVLDVYRLTVIPALTLWVGLWVATVFPYQPKPYRHIDSWKLNEPAVCAAHGFNHQQYVEWLERQ